MDALVIQQLRKTYRNQIEALKEISLTIKKGDFFALLGVNGAGKSTTIGIISTLLTKTSGSVIINGYNIDQNPLHAKATMGLVPQEINLNIFETCENTLFNQAGFYGISRSEAEPQIEILLTQLNLQDKRHSFVRNLSGGMKRRLMIARALVHKPNLLILDEPTAGVDIEIRHNIWNFLRHINENGTTIILTTHYLEEAEQLCKHIAIIDKGKIIEHTSMHHLLSQIRQQTFIFTTMESMVIFPSLAPYTSTQLDSHHFELRLNEQQSLNDVFTLLTQKGLQIQSLRHKINRLEELFLDRIHHDN